MQSNNLVEGGARNYSIDLLKVISMIMVVVLHINMFGGFNQIARFSNDISFKLIVNFYEQICIIAVNVFVIISSWFLSSNKNSVIKSRRVLNLLVSMFIWYIIISIIALCLGIQPTRRELLQSIPIIGLSYDFIAGYIVLYLLHPLFNRLIHHIDKKDSFRIVIILLVVFCFASPIVRNQYLMVYGGYSFAWFICIYFIVAYIRKYLNWSRFSSSQYFLFFILLVLIGTIARSFLPSLYLSKGYYNDPVLFMSSVFCFLSFVSNTIRNKKTTRIIAFCAPLSVACFFIHANPFIEQWFSGLGINMIVNESVILYVLFTTFLAIFVFSLSIILEFIRIKIFSLVKIEGLINNISDKIDKYLVFSSSDNFEEPR